jgi:hydantoinase/carbamoylase family amidase
MTTFALHDAIAELATYNDDPAAGGITREVFTPTYERSVGFVSGLMRDAGLEVRRDAFGNLYGRLEGTDPSLPAVRTGSHFDTTLNAGRYDGVVGVLGAIEAIGALRDRGLRRPIEIVGFAGEEPRFVTGCIGSRTVMGDLSRADLDRLVDRDGVSLAQALAGAGFEPDDVDSAVWDPASVHAFVELHIEQGIVLESSGEQIGVVTAIAAPHDLRVTLRGAADHAGATPMRLRRDALAGAAEAMVALEKLAVDSSSGTTVGTVGVLRVRPGAINVVPGEVELDVDVRDSDGEARQAVVDGFVAAVGVLADRRGLTAVVDEIVRDEPGTCAPFIVEAVETACASLGVTRRRMISGAYHDALMLSRKIPVGMLFVPSVGGISHHPDEHTDREDIDRGAAVLGEVLATLAH